MLAVAIGAISMTTGCVVYTDDDHHQQDPPAYVNYEPEIAWAEAGCYYDDYNRDFVWWFDSAVFDDNGHNDIYAVYADVYDRHGFVDSFELYNETPDPDEWFSDWLQWSTNLDCYYGGYEVEFVAYDVYDAVDFYAVYPATY